MGSRSQLVRPAHLVEKYGEGFPIWSYSRIGTYKGCEHEYYLGRILKKEGVQNIYGLLGGTSHDALQEYYEGNITYGEMLSKFENDFLDFEISDYKFTSDEVKNERMTEKYKACMQHFFKHHIPIKSKVLCEKEVWIDTGKAVFIGYVDAIHKEPDGTYIITDYKTSSMGAEYKGENLKEKQKQLLLYTLALVQLGIPQDTIKIRWNFLKYTNIRYNHMISVTYMKNDKLTKSTMKKEDMITKLSPQLKKDIKALYPELTTKQLKAEIDLLKEDGNLTRLPQEIQDKYVIEPVIKQGERCKWVESIKTQLKKDLIADGFTDLDAELMYVEAVESNSLDNIPPEIASNFILEDCYVYGEVSNETMTDLVTGMNKAVEDITAKGTDEEQWQKNKLECDKSGYYCNNLCGYRKHCKFYSQYLKDLKEQQEGYKKESADIMTLLENL